MVLGDHLHRHAGCNLGTRGDHDIGMGKQLMKLGEVGRISEIERHTKLACVVHRKGKRNTLTNRCPGTSGRTLGWFDLDDLGAKIAKQPWTQFTINNGEVDDAKPFERSSHGPIGSGVWSGRAGHFVPRVKRPSKGRRYQGQLERCASLPSRHQ